METLPTELNGPLLLKPRVYADPRGFFMETYREREFLALGIEQLVQDNHSRSQRGIVRGMHFQPGMSKLIRCVRGAILDVLVDIRPASATFGQWEGFELSDENYLQLYCPDGFAHGFCVLSEVADVIYGCSDYYDPEREGGFSFQDPEVGIQWPAGLSLSASARDTSAPRLRELAPRLHELDLG
jgi:dTDP-4-dehydrorhamnose 3,5-epimerase